MAGDDRSTIKIGAKDTATPILKKLQKGLRQGLVNAFRLAWRAAKTFGKVIAVSVVAVMAIAIKRAAQFQNRMAEVQTLLGSGSAAREAVEGMGRAVLAMTDELPKTADDLGAGLYQVLSAGVEAGSDAMDVLTIAAEAAVGGLSSTLTSVDALTTVINAYGGDVTRAAQISDIMFQTVRDGKITFDQLATSIGTVASTAALGGVSFEEVGAAIATMTKAGIDANTSTTSLNRLILAIIDPTDEAAAAAGKYGIELSAAALKSRGFAGIMNDIAEATNGNVEALQEIIPEMRAFRAGSILAGTQAAEFQRNVENQDRALGAAKEAFEVMNEAAAQQWQLLKNKLNLALIEAGQKILPEFTKAMKDAAEPVGAILKAFKDNPDAVAAFGSALATIIPTIVTFFGWVADVVIQMGKLLGIYKEFLGPGRKLRSELIATNEALAEKGGVLGLEAQATALEGVRKQRAKDLAAAKADLAELQEAQEQIDKVDPDAGGGFTGMIEDARQEVRRLTGEVDAFAAARDNALLLAADLKTKALLPEEEDEERTRVKLENEGEAKKKVDLVGDANIRLKGILDDVAAAERAVVFSRNTPEELGNQELLRQAREQARDDLFAELELLKKSGLEGDDLAKAINNIARAMAKLKDDAVVTLDQTIGVHLGENSEAAQKLAAALDDVAEAERALGLASTDEERAESTKAVAAANQVLIVQLQAVAVALIATLPPGQMLDSLLAEIFAKVQALAGAAVSLEDAFAVAVGNIISMFASDFGQAIAGAFEAMVSGAESAGEAFRNSMLLALASVAKAFGQFFIAQAIAAAGFGLVTNPAGFAAAAKYTAAAVAMFALAGALSAVAGGGGAGGGGAAAQQATASQETRGSITIVIEGGFLDMSDPRQEQQLSRAIEDLTGRDVNVRTRRATSVGGEAG